MQPCLFNKAMSHTLGKVGNQEWPEGRTTDGNTTFIWQGRVSMATDGHGKYTV